MVMLGYRKPEILSESVAYTLSGACCAIFSTLKGKPRLTINRYWTPIAGIKATLMFQHLGLNNCKALHKQVLVFICFIIATHLAVCLYTVLLRGGWYRSVNLPPPSSLLFQPISPSSLLFRVISTSSLILRLPTAITSTKRQNYTF